MLTRNSPHVGGAHVGGAAYEAVGAVDISKDMVLEWFKHPVTKVLAIVIAAELVHRAVLHYGVKYLIGAKEASLHADA